MCYIHWSSIEPKVAVFMAHYCVIVTDSMVILVNVCVFTKGKDGL